MHSIDMKLAIIDMLQQRGTYSVSTSGIQHYTRCPFCGDSQNLSHAHLSVKINTDNDNEPMVYRCLKCNVSGLVTEDFLDELDVYIDTDMRKSLKTYTKKSMRYAKLTNMDAEKFIVPLCRETDRNLSKLRYVNDRLGLSLDLADAQNRKMILSIGEFMKANDILSTKREYLTALSTHQLKVLEDCYVGFLSTNNNCIVFRDITGTQKYRYYKAVLNERNVNIDSFYSVPSSIDLLYTHDIDVHMAEGIFDILSIKENLHADESHQYFYAACGFGGVSILKYLIHHGINTGIRLHIYSDNDKTDWSHKKYLYKNSALTSWIDRIYIHRNQFPGEKDYGIPMERIVDSRRIIK